MTALLRRLAARIDQSEPRLIRARLVYATTDGAGGWQFLVGVEVDAPDADGRRSYSIHLGPLYVNVIPQTEESVEWLRGQR